MVVVVVVEQSIESTGGGATCGLLSLFAVVPFNVMVVSCSEFGSPESWCCE